MITSGHDMSVVSVTGRKCLGHSRWLVGYRQQLERCRADVKLRIRDLLREERLKPPVNAWTRAWREWLDQTCGRSEPSRWLLAEQFARLTAIESPMKRSLDPRASRPSPAATDRQPGGLESTDVVDVGDESQRPQELARCERSTNPRCNRSRPSVIEDTLGRLAAGENLSIDDMTKAVEAIMLGLCGEEEIALLLTGLHLKGETVEEIAGAARALRAQMTPIRTRRAGVIDTCGTGGDASGTFNISTAAALVTAAAGVPVAKHGNRRVTSRSGSADVLAELGVNVEADVATVEACLDELGICFCFAPLLHASMRHAAPVRQRLGIRTIFNLLGPLTNPAAAPFQLLGAGQADLQPLLADALAILGTQRAAVVRGDDGLDEVTLAGPTRVILVEEGLTRELVWRPEQFGVRQANLDALRVGGPVESAALIGEVLGGAAGPARDIVVVNAAAALWTAGKSTDLGECGARAAEAIDSGAARQLLDRLIAQTR